MNRHILLVALALFGLLENGFIGFNVFCQIAFSTKRTKLENGKRATWGIFHVRMET
ncbi:MAG: hypothetical protein SGI77_02995 [Pirellulaceae bacterium]|nr:hypothetical protein [Pirellulaceae bacterium]